MSKFRLFVYFAIIFSIAGCALRPAQKTEMPVIYTEQTASALLSDIENLMRYYQMLQDKKPFELQWEYAYAKHHYRNDKNAENRFKYILLVILPNTHFRDTSLALNLLTNWPEDIPLSPNLTSFRKILTTSLKDLRSAKYNNQNLLQKLKASEERIKALQDKIDAIKSMERQLFRGKIPQ